MGSKERLALRAVREAARLRVAQGFGPSSPLCPLDLAEQLGILVRLAAFPSLEGMLTPGPPPMAVLGVERPWGRIRHTCAHEIGHWVFGHRARVDMVGHRRRPGWRPDEFVVDRFAAALMMPKLAVVSALARRKWTVASLTPARTFSLAQEFGVGYRNLVGHMERSLGMISARDAEALRRKGQSLAVVRGQLAGFDPPHDVFVVDEHWGERPVDVETGDIVVVPSDSLFCGSCGHRVDDPVPHVRGVAPGEGQLVVRRRRETVHVRVSRRGFTGLARYRHLPEWDDG